MISEIGLFTLFTVYTQLLSLMFIGLFKVRILESKSRLPI